MKPILLVFHYKQASQQGTIFGVATQHLLHLAADPRVYLMLILHLRVSSSDSSEVERLASILGDPRSIPPISKNIFVGNWAWFGLAILLSNSASSQNKAPCWEVWQNLQFQNHIFQEIHIFKWQKWYFQILIFYIIQTYSNIKVWTLGPFSTQLFTGLNQT